MIWLATLSTRLAFGWVKSILMRPGRTTVATLVWAVCFWTGLRFGGGCPWSWWSQLTFSGRSDFSIPLACVSLASKALAFCQQSVQCEGFFSKGKPSQMFWVELWVMADFNSLSRLENSQWAASFLNRVANWLTILPAVWTACWNW